jgi:hypothetical protein
MQFQQQQQSSGPQVIRPQFGMPSNSMGGHLPSTAVKVAPSVSPSLASTEQQSEEMDTSSPSKPSSSSWNGHANAGDWEKKNAGDWGASQGMSSMSQPGMGSSGEGTQPGTTFFYKCQGRTGLTKHES